MVKSAKERMAEYRRRKRENQETYEKYKAEERARWHRRKEGGAV